MSKNKTLLIMAAGMGSRFSQDGNDEVKQIAKVGPNGEFLIDYSIYDAIQEGFQKVVFVIKKEHEMIFRQTVGNRVSKYIQVEYAFQDIQDIPAGYSVPAGRDKPWGTAHAILAARNIINEPFVIINADDFYGRDAYRVAAKFLDNNQDDHCYSVIGYQVKNTLSENGAVKRGICLEENHQLVELIESNVIEHDGVITATPLDGRSMMIVDQESLVSMNMLCFTPTIFEYIERKFPKFLDQNLSVNPLKCEYLIPDVLDAAKREQFAKVCLERTTAKWYGMTYYEDKALVVASLSKMIEKGDYPVVLWDSNKGKRI
ncbi:MAG: nucleotidyltransferase [Bacilli bacterium]|jgi:UTP-glucose-1-phosphate uridylyltransferase|nr:nucleotidyltransferase [Bacilli bacterium]